MARTLKVEIIGSADSLEKAFGKASRSTKSFGDRLKGMGKAGAIGLGAAGVGGAIAVLKSGFAEVAESQKVMAQTEAVLKSTGGAANVSAKEIESLAGAISKKSGIDDEAIQSGQNLLLTFTNLKNEAGAGNAIFNQSTVAIADMSTALGQDMSSSAIQLGKALNDPIKGITALSRVGVSFTEGQRDSIKAMVEAGDSMGAQKVILAELNKEFGGSAEAVGKTLPGQMKILKNSFDEASAKVATAMLPALTKMMKGLADLIAWIELNWPAFKKAFDDAAAVVKAMWDKVEPIFAGWVKALQGLVDFVKAIVAGDWSAAWDAWKQIVTGVFTAVIENLKLQWEIIKTAMTKLGEKAVEGIKSGLLLLDDAVKTAIKLGLTAIKDLAESAFDTAKSWGGKILGGIKSGVLAVDDAVRAAANAGLAAIRGLLDDAFNAASKFGGKILSGIVDGLSGLAGKLKDLILAPINAIIGKINDISIPAFTVSIDTHLPEIGKLGFSSPSFDPIPHIPALFKGGFITGTGIALVHKGETVVPAGRGGTEVIVLQLDGQVLARWVRSELQRVKGRNVSLEMA